MCAPLLAASPAHAAMPVTTITGGTVMSAGWQTYSPNAAFRLTMQTDGNFVLYRQTDGAALWHTNTWGRPGAYAKFQTDGNLVVYSNPNNALWHSVTWDSPGATLRLQDDGNLVIYRSNGSARWFTDTWQRPQPMSLGAKAANIAGGQVGVVESGALNSGSQVNTYQRTVGNDKVALNAAWCASFVTWAFQQAGDPTPFRSASVRAWYDAAKNGQYGMALVARNQAALGDIVSWLDNSGTGRHIGIISSFSASGEPQVVSGNTSNPYGGRDGVFIKPLSNWNGLGWTPYFIRNNS
jgi:hypothetical protein